MHDSFFKKNINIGRKNGFTLVELLIVVAVVGLLSSIVLVSTKEGRTKAKIAKKVQVAASFNHKLGSELVGEWMFNEGTDYYAADTLGKSEPCAIFPAGSWVSSAEPNMKNAYQFNGHAIGCAGGSLNDSLNLGGGDITITAWIKVVTPVSSGRIFEYFGSSGSAFTFSISSTNKIYASLDLYTAAQSIKALAVGEWYFVAFSYQNSAQTLNYYVDGELDSSQNFSSYWAYNSANTPYYIGRNLRSVIDEVRVYKTSLLSSDIKNIYALEAKKYEK